jgi:hypothetical protein
LEFVESAKSTEHLNDIRAEEDIGAKEDIEAEDDIGAKDDIGAEDDGTEEDPVQFVPGRYQGFDNDENVKEKNQTRVSIAEGFSVYTLATYLNDQLLSRKCQLYRVRITQYNINVRAEAVNCVIDLGDLNRLISCVDPLAKRIISSNLTNDYYFPYLGLKPEKDSPVKGPWVLRHVAMHLAAKYDLLDILLNNRI